MSDTDQKAASSRGDGGTADRSEVALARVRALHTEQKNTRCRAYWHHEGPTPPGPVDPPLFCVKGEGHDGAHTRDWKSSFEPNGWHDHLPGLCNYDRETWPCKTVRIIDGETDANCASSQDAEATRD